MKSKKHGFSTEEAVFIQRRSSVITIKRSISQNFLIEDISENVQRLLGFSVEELTSSSDTWFNRLKRRDKEQLLDFYRNLSTKKDAETIEYSFRKSNGEWILLREEAALFEKPGSKNLLSSVSILPENKSDDYEQLKQELKNRLKYQDVLSKCSNLLIDDSGSQTVNKALKLLLDITDTDRVYIFTSNKKDEQIYLSQIYEVCREGVKPEIDNPELQNMSFDSLPYLFGELAKNKVINIPIKELPDNEREFMEEQDIKSFLLLPIFIEEEWFGFLGFDSTRFEKHWEDYEVKILHTVAEIIGTFFKRKFVEESLISQKNFTQQVLNSLPGITIVMNTNLEVVQWSTMTEILTGYTQDEISGMSAFKFVSPDEYANMKQAFKRILSKRTEGQELNLINKSGKKTPYFWRGNIIEMDGEKLFVIVGLNITEQKAMERALKEEKKLADTIINTLPGIFYMVDKEGAFLKVNDNFISDLGYSEEEIKKMTTFDFYSNEQIPLLTEKMNEVFESGSTSAELNIRTKDGREEPYYLKAVRLNRGDKSYLVGTGYSIRNQKQREKELKTSLNEKQVLLQEIHHRVKNNLAVISGLLELQVQEHADEKFQHLINDSQRRIQTMAIIHEKLYQSESLSKISMLQYMNELISQIGNSFDVTKRNIQINTSIEDVELSINQAIPFALAMNEIISNSLEHAFKGREKGELKVELREEENNLHIQLEDDGIGYNPEETGAGSLGTTLINALLTQIGAEWTMDSENGVKYDIIFRKNPVELLTNTEA